MQHFTFHLLGLVHLPANTKYSACAFTIKCIRMARMLVSLGHTVYYYGAEGSNVQDYCKNLPGQLIFVQTHSLADIATSFGDGINEHEIGYDWTKEDFRHDFSGPKTAATLKFESTCISEIRKNAQLDHILLVTMGSYHTPIADAVGLFMRVESGIGYRGSVESNFRIFESSYIRNYTLGSAHPYEALTGSFYDRVISNYLDPADFDFSDFKEDYLLFIGRLMFRKGITIAADIANHTGIPLKIVGQGGIVLPNGHLEATKNTDFSLAPGNWTYEGFADVAKRKQLMSKARATIVATTYLEPFGTVHVESMLSGTPPVTTDFGVFPETIPDYLNGKVGFRCNTLDDFVKATLKTKDVDHFFIAEYASKFLMDNVKYQYQKYFEDLYRVYESRDGKSKGWEYVS